MNAKITLNCDDAKISGSVIFKGTTVDKLMICMALLEELKMGKDDAMMLALMYSDKGCPGFKRTKRSEETETRIDLAEYLKQKEEEE